MNWVTVIWAMIASACLTLSVVHGLVWWRRKDARAHALFALSATGTAALAGIELWMMRASSPVDYGTAVRWAHVPIWVIVVSLVGFVSLYLRSGRRWLAWTVIASRTVALLLNFLVGHGLNYREITGIDRIRFLGEPVSVGVGIPNPWMLVGQLSSLLLLLFVADACVTAWRRGERHKALTVGGSIVLFVLAGTAQAVLVLWGVVRMPIAISFFYVGIVIAMGYELSRELLRAMQLSDDLRESEERLSVTASAANLGLWTQDLARNQIWATEKWRTLFGFAPNQQLELNHVLQRLHPLDRESVSQTLAKVSAEGGDYETEHRIVLPDGQVRWIASRGQVECNVEQGPVLMRGVSLDITERRGSEIEAQELRQGLALAGRVTMLGQLASSLAHELSQPLSAILRNAEAAEMLLRSKTPDMDELRAIISDIHKDDQRAGDVIDRLRSLLKRRTLQSNVLDVGTLVDEVITLVRSDALVRRVELTTDVPRELPPARGDRVHLLQVLLNLIINAMDAVNDQPAGERLVKLQVRFDGSRMIEMAVTDSGNGVAPEKINELFQPFFTTKPQGMGMGLPISRTIVEAHGGRIWAENNAGRGATFRFTLCAAKDGGLS